MNTRISKHLLFLASVAAIGGLAPAMADAADKPLPTIEQPLQPERNPPGDIPDNQVFVDYVSPLGFSLKVPEGWARLDRANGAVFEDKYGRIIVTEVPVTSPPDVAMAKSELVPQLQQEARAVTVDKVKEIKRPAGNAIVISYGSNSDPNPVTNKAIRLENDRYYFWKDGNLAMIDLSAPAGADNVDQWNLISKSFRWQ
jgi:hypothetical protein